MLRCIITFVVVLLAALICKAQDGKVGYQNNNEYYEQDTIIVKIPGNIPSSKTLVFRSKQKFSVKTGDYKDYHLSRIRADKEIFVDKDYIKGLSIYKDLFKKFDFVFLSDCIVVLQIALFIKDERMFLEAVDKATKNGLLPRHLTHIEYVKAHPFYIKNKDSIVKLYQLNRKNYLSRLDTATVTETYRLYAIDQTQKNNKRGENHATHLRRYRQEISQTFTELNELLAENKFPGEKLIGVDQNDIMKELKTGKPDIKQYRSLYKDIGDYMLPQMELNEMSFATTVLVPLIIHFATMEGSKAMHQFLTKDRYFQELAKGMIHPNDYAAFNDCTYLDNLTDPKTVEFEKGGLYFGVLGNVSNIPAGKINALRKEYFLSPLSVAEAKIHFMKGQGMYYNMGWDGIYSR